MKIFVYFSVCLEVCKKISIDRDSFVEWLRGVSKRKTSFLKPSLLMAQISFSLRKYHGRNDFSFTFIMLFLLLQFLMYLLRAI